MNSQRAHATLDDVRLAIFRQHTQLSQLLDELEESALAVIDGGECATLNAALQVLHPRFVHHLEYEELYLARWLPPHEEGWALLGDHQDQRRAIEGLIHDRAVFEDARSLAREALTFVHRLRREMVVEDAELRSLREPTSGAVVSHVRP